MLYRQLTRIGSNDALAILKKAATIAATPLEKITLAAALAAANDTANDGKFMKRLNYLRKSYQNYPGNGKMNTWQAFKASQALESPANYDADALLKLNAAGRQALLVLSQPVTNSGIIGSQLQPKPGNLYAYSRLFSHFTGKRPFFLESSQNLTVWINGQKFPRHPDNQDFTVVDLPIIKGKNTFVVEIPDDDGSGFLMEPLDYQNWFDDAIARKELHQHLAWRASGRLANPASPKYSGGENPLTDGLRASNSYADGFWQGFEATDLHFTIDLQNMQTIRQITAGFLRDDNAWIFLPESVEFAVSKDGLNFQVLKNLKVDQPASPRNPYIEDVSVKTENIQARYVRVYAWNIDKNPAWHKAPGGKSWIFVDEILVR